jgi:murein DD-endopeptidase MepM/ murein hydrolase activator NlpD
MPGIHGLSQQQLLDPNANIMKGAEILANNYKQWGTWEYAVKSYLAGDPRSTARDAMGSDVNSYWSTVNGYFNELNGGGGTTGQAPVSNLNVIWGGVDRPITQEHGPSDFSLNVHPEWYNYSIPLLGTRGHPGVDVGMPRGTQIFTPVGGTVKIVSPNNGYADNQGGVGQIMVELDNGHQIIFGHMAGSAVRVGDRVQPGQLVGSSGTYNGDHLHLEYRIPSTKYGGTQEAVDPRLALMGNFSGTISSPNNALPGVGRAYTYNDLLKEAANGGNFFYGAPLMQSGSTWNAWVQNALAGQIPFGSPAQGELSGNATNGYTPRLNPLTTPAF